MDSALTGVNRQTDRFAFSTGCGERRSRYALARQPSGLRSGTLYCTAKRSERSERATPLWGLLRTILNKNRLQKFLSFFDRVYSTISPVSACNCSKNVFGPVSTRPTISILSRNIKHCLVNGGKLLLNQGFNLICDEFMFILGTISTT